MNRVGSTKVALTWFAACVITLALMSYASANQGDFTELYNYYFPKESHDVRATYRHYVDKFFFGSPPSPSKAKRVTQVYLALQGDDGALHAFLHNPAWAVNGAPGEECVYESVLLLLRLGDDRFSEILAREDAETRKKVGYAIDPHIDWYKHPFPKTRALYSYRFVPSSQVRPEK